LQVVDEFRGEIASDVESLSKAVVECENEEKAIDREHQQFLTGVETVHSAINKQVTQLKQVAYTSFRRLL